jgi:hypothetical protein
LNSNGSLDSTFHSTVSQVSGLFIQEDERPIVQVADTAALSGTSLVRLNTDGTIDPTFAAAGMHLASLGGYRG